MADRRHVGSGVVLNSHARADNLNTNVSMRSRRAVIIEWVEPCLIPLNGIAPRSRAATENAPTNWVGAVLRDGPAVPDGWSSSSYLTPTSSGHFTRVWSQ